MSIIREGIRARIIDWLNPWESESPDKFVVPFWGYRYSGRFDNAQDHQVYFRGGYENPELNLLAAIAAEIENSIAFDVGAHTGQHMLLLSRLCSQVYAFEPFPDAWEVAKARLESNHIGNVELLHFGLGAEDCEIPYYWDPSNLNRMAGSFVAEHAHLAEFGKLQLRQGDAWARDAGVSEVDLIKIDVEGFEGEVLRGMPLLLGSEPFILMEVSWTAFDRIEAAGGLSSILPFRFDLFRVESGRDALLFDFRGYRLTPIEQITRPDQWGYNILVVPRSRPRLRAVTRMVRG